MTTDTKMKLSGTVAALGFVAAFVCGILFMMKLPIFSETTLAWAFVVGLMSTAVAVLSVIIRAIWEN